MYFELAPGFCLEYKGCLQQWQILILKPFMALSGDLGPHFFLLL